VTRRAAEIRLSLAVDLPDRLPGTKAALQAGRIDLGKAKAIAELTANLAVGEALAVVEERVLRRSGEQTVPELRRSLLRAVARVDPAANAKRNHQARAERFLRVQPCRNGMAELTGRMPAEDAMTVFGALDSLACCAAPEDTRSIDARRVDALVDLCRPGWASEDPPSRPDDGSPAASDGEVPAAPRPWSSRPPGAGWAGGAAGGGGGHPARVG
jgi:Domain of unknown function (DUF222)